MPKKTKKEKLIAQIHRATKQNNLPERSFNASPNVSLPKADAQPGHFQFKAISVPKRDTLQENNDAVLIKSIAHDLQKTLILAGLAIGGEIVLSWTLK